MILITENTLQDDILDKMVDDNIPYDNLTDDEKYILKYGEYPEHTKKEKENTYIGIENELEFIYDKIQKNPDNIILFGTVLFKNHRYTGKITIDNQKINVQFYNKIGEEFDPRNNKKYAESFSFLINTVLRDKLKGGIKNENKIIKYSELDKTARKYDDENNEDEELIVQDVEEKQIFERTIKTFEQKSLDHKFNGKDYIPLIDSQYLLYVNKYDKSFPITSYDENNNEFVIINNIYPKSKEWNKIYNKLSHNDKEKLNNI